MEGNKNIFEEIKHINNNLEYWFARELQEVLEYKEWRFFEKVIKNAIINCKNSGIEEKNILEFTPSCQNATIMLKLK